VKALAIAGTNLRRLVRFRANVFFIVILPMMIILLLGVTFGGRSSARIGVTTSGIGQLGGQLVDALDAEQGVAVRRYATAGALVAAVERGRVLAGLVVPEGYDRRLRAGEQVALSYYARPDSLAQQLRVSVEAAVAGQALLVRAARFVERERGSPFEASLARATAAAAFVPEVSVRAVTPGGGPYPAGVGRFDLGASSQLILFVFLTGLNGAIALVETRRLGVSRRMLSTPTSAGTIVVGEALGRFGIALVQGAIIVLGSLLLFSVNWGDPLAPACLLVAIALVGAGAGMLLGSLVDSDQQAGALSLLLALGLAALGGCMVPLEVFPPLMKTVAHVTPQAWAIDAYGELIRHGGNLGDVLEELAILLAYAAVLLALGARALRRTLTA
jgi:ABC-2 type transport system permease protein